MRRKDAPNGTQLATTSRTLNPGDSIGLQVIGTAIKAYYKSGGGVWTVVSALNTTNSSYSGSGRLIFASGTGVTNTLFDDFSGGTVLQGVQVSSRSDTLSDPRPSATSNHTFAFTVNNSIVGSSASNSSTLTLIFDPAFQLPVGMDCGDVDAATSVQFNFNYPGCAATATAWGFSATGSVITLVPPSGTGVYVPTSTQVTIKIGSNATVGQQGAHWITNPSTAGIYTISVGGTFGGSGNMLVSINAGVTVQATVAESLALTVSSVKAVNCSAGAWKVHLVGSDIRRHALQVAERGLYPQSALRHVSRELVQGYFAKVGQHFLVKPRLRNLVTFTPMNLAAPNYIGRFDCIFCMDVLPHFSTAQRIALVHRLHLYLEPGGYLFLGDGEKIPAMNVTFNYQKNADYILYQKPLAAAAKSGR